MKDSGGKAAPDVMAVQAVGSHCSQPLKEGIPQPANETGVTDRDHRTGMTRGGTNVSRSHVMEQAVSNH